jgi:hypothetical protein
MRISRISTCHLSNSGGGSGDIGCYDDDDDDDDDNDDDDYV